MTPKPKKQKPTKEERINTMMRGLCKAIGQLQVKRNKKK